MKETVLAVKWSKKENDLMIHYPRRCDGALVHYMLLSDRMIFDYTKWCETKYESHPPAPYKMESLIKELEERGYDIKTLKFSIELKKQPEE